MKEGQIFNPYGLFRGMFIPNGIAKSHLPDPAKLLLGRLFQYAGQDGKAFPARKKLAKELNWELRKLDRNISLLKREKLISTFQSSDNSPSTYVFIYSTLYNGGTDKNDDTSTVKNDSTPAVKSDSSPPVKNGKHNKFNNNKFNTNKSFSKEKQQSKDCDLILKCWESVGGKIHTKVAKKGPETIQNMIEELLSPGLNPYYKLLDCDDSIDHTLKTKEWKVKEIKSCIKYFARTLKKPVDFYFHDFILFRWSAPGARNKYPDHSRLVDVYKELPKKIKHTKLSKFLKKKLNGSAEGIPEKVFINAATFLKKTKKKYKVHSGASTVYRGKLKNLFVEHVRLKTNDSKFKLHYISGDTFHQQFIEEELKLHGIEKLRR